MRSLLIALKDLRIRLRDRSTLVMMLLLPVVLTAIIGFAFGGDSGISAIPVTIVAPDEDGPVAWDAAALFGQVELFDVDRATEEEAREAVASGSRSAAVVVPPSLRESMFAGTPTEIRVLRDPASRVKAGIVTSMAERFATVMSGSSIVGRGVVHTLEGERDLTEAEQGLLFGWISQRMRDAWGEPPITIEEVTEETEDINVHAYFAPSFAVLFLLFTMLASAKSIHEERESGTYERLMSAPITRVTFLSGKLLGTYLLAAVQLLILIGLGKVLFAIDWGSHPGAVLVMALATAAGAASVATLIAAVTRTARQTDQVGTVTVLVMSLMGGSMWPIEQAPPTFQRIARFTFNYWAHSGFKKLVFEDAGLAGISQELLIIVVMSSVLFVLSVRLLSRR